MIPPLEFYGPHGNTLFMTAATSRAVLVTRAGKRMRRRALDFANEHAALDWCLSRRAIFVLMPRAAKVKLN